MSHVRNGKGLDDFRCPRCLSPLEQSNGNIRCRGCGQEYHFDQGIPDLRVSRFDYYFNPIPKERMRALSQEINSTNWTRSVREFVDLAPSPSWIDNIAVPGRYSWKLLMQLPPNAKVLDIGCGLGALISNIAPHVGSAYATDLTVERLIFSGGRFEAFNEKDDIRVVASGDGEFLPFTDDTFDAVFLSGVLEWVGEGDTSGFSEGSKTTRLFRMLSAHFGETNPRKIQLKFLKEIYRLLKPEGELYVGIENRLSYEYLGQRRDHHSRLWFGSLMPRLPATLYSIAISRKPYRTYTYGRRGYRRLLSEAGFKSVELFGFNDGYSDLKSIVPAGTKVQRWKPKTYSDLRQRIKHHPDFVPAYGILASKREERGPRLLDRLLEKIEREVGSELNFTTFAVDASDRAVLKGSLKEESVSVKLPMSRVSLKRESSNLACLTDLRATRIMLCGLVPEPVVSGSYQAQPYFVESSLHGVAPSHRIGKGSVLSVVQSVRKTMEAAFWDDERESFSSELFDRLVLPRVIMLSEVLPDPAESDQISEALSTMLGNLLFRKGCMHGDMDFSKVFFDASVCTGVADWHAGAVDGVPIVDALTLAGAALKIEHPGSDFTSLLGYLMTGDEWQRSSAAPILCGFLDDASLTAAQRKGVVYLYWLYSVTNQLPLGLQYDSAALRVLVDPIVANLRSEIFDVT